MKTAARYLAAMSILVFALALPRGAAHAAGTSVQPPGQYYLALGDSLAYGFQQARFNAEMPNVNAASFNTGYADDFARMLRTIRPDLQLINMGCPGETTASFLSGCAYAQAGAPLHYAYSGSQLSAALAFLQAHQGQVNPITIDLGANDIDALISSCNGLSNLSCVASGLPATVKTIATNLTTILTQLRAAAPTAQIIVMQLYDPYAAADASTNALAPALNNTLAAVAGAVGAQVADAFTPFNLAQPQPQVICTLTLFCTPLHDIHASDAGYLVIAQVFWNASGFGKMIPGFLINFTSASPGQGEVYFGSGPGCSGLVEVATQDLNPGSTIHSVWVKGNDLPGTVGDNGITAGQTYSFETVTIGSTGPTVDNNSGNCYSVTAAGM